MECLFLYSYWWDHSVEKQKKNKNKNKNEFNSILLHLFGLSFFGSWVWGWVLNSSFFIIQHTNTSHMSYSFLLLCVGVLIVLWTTLPVVVWSQPTCVLTPEEVTLGYVSEIYDSLLQNPNEPIGWYAFNCGMCGYYWFLLIF